MNEILVQTDHVKKYFPLKGSLSKKKARSVKAVDDITLSIRKGETLGLVGESGSGKTTLSRILLGLLPPTQGKVLINGKDIYAPANHAERHRSVGAVFQDPASSLNPRATIYRSLERPLRINGYDAKDARELILETAEKVNIGRELLDRFPHELSGGQQQRVSIARAIMLKPQLVILDEPTSALDVSVQAQTLNELLNLQQEFGLTYLFITHNLSVVRYMSDRICVMYGGRLMEMGSTQDVYERHLHPYTAGLLSSVPPLNPAQRSRKRYLLSGDMPSLIDAPAGCRFCSRCRFARPECAGEMPQLHDVGGGHLVECPYALELEGQ